MKSKSLSLGSLPRLKTDYLRLKKDPLPYVTAEPLPNNILEWHYVISGPENSLYSSGLYHGKLVFPSEFPFKPPSIYMFTPNGRFSINTRLCLSFSDFHPDSWNPTWSVGTILTALLSFMLESTPTLGSISTDDKTKRHLAASSLQYNLNNSFFTELFPSLALESQKELKRRKDSVKNSTSSSSSSSSSSFSSSSPISLAEVRNGSDLWSNGYFSGALTNFLVLSSFAAFAFIVKYVITLNLVAPESN